MKIVLNKCYGGFHISDEGYEWLLKNKNWKCTTLGKDGEWKNSNAKIYKSEEDIPFGGKYYFTSDDRGFRTNKDVIEMVKILKEKASFQTSKIEIIEIPDNVDYEIEEHAGIEHVAEKHNTWG